MPLVNKAIRRIKCNKLVSYQAMKDDGGVFKAFLISSGDQNLTM